MVREAFPLLAAGDANGFMSKVDVAMKPPRPPRPDDPGAPPAEEG